MIVQDIITRVRRTFGDEAAVQVTDEDVIRWINDGQIEIVKHNDGPLQKTDFVNIVSGQSQYTMPTDLLILRSIRYKFSDMLSFKNLRYMSIQQFDEAIDGWDGSAYNGASPLLFTFYEGKVVIFPTPNQSMTAGLKVLYNQKPADVVGLLDAIPLPLIYHNALVKYCMWQASQLDEDHEPAMMYRSDFQSDMDMLLNKETTDPVATYHVITVREEDL